jgi:hypothetical protein
MVKFSETNLKHAVKTLFVRKRANVFLLEPHLGLGDSLVNIGLIKTLSVRNPDFFYYYACLPSSLQSVNWALQYLSNLYPVPVARGKEARQLAEFYNCEHLYIGGPEVEKRCFDSFYYRQHQVPFDQRWKLAETPAGPRSEWLFHQLNPLHQPYILVNAVQSGDIKYTLQIANPDNKKIIEVSPMTNNIFDWTKLVMEADEIHTIDTSFVHFVEGVLAEKSTMPLFYHLARLSETEFTRHLPWITIDYEHPRVLLKTY